MLKILPAAVVVHTDLRVTIYAQHKSSYVKSNLQRHLRDAHLIHSTKDSSISAYVDSLEIASNPDEVSRPSDRTTPIYRIPVYNRFKCTADPTDGCRYITIHEPNIKQHLRIKHRKKLGSKGRPRRDERKESEYYRVKMQTLFAEKKNINYFFMKISGHENDAGL